MQAVKAYKGAVQAHEGHPAAALALVKLHLDKGDIEAARSVCAQFLASQPDNVDAQLLMVQLHCSQVRSRFTSFKVFACLLQLVNKLCMISGLNGLNLHRLLVTLCVGLMAKGLNCIEYGSNAPVYCSYCSVATSHFCLPNQAMVLPFVLKSSYHEMTKAAALHVPAIQQPHTLGQSEHTT